MSGIFINYCREDSEATRAGAAANDTEYSVTLVKTRGSRPRGLYRLGNPENSERFITSESDGSSTLDFRITTGEHRFKFTDKDTNTEHSGTFS